MTRLFTILLLLVALVPSLIAQAKPAPQSADAPKSSPKDDISGMYSFTRDGEFVQINQEDDGVVSGFVSRFGEDVTDKKTFLDQFFSKGSLQGTALTFTTKTVHGTWFEFAGNVQRGPGKTPADEGFRIIRGKLTRHKVDEKGKESAESREIEMKSFPADMDDDD
jgi:hypothetical protein